MVVCAILYTDSVKCWGNGSLGGLGSEATAPLGDGNGEMGDSLPFVNLGVTRSARSISIGDQFVCVHLDNGTIKCWGYNSRGQLGQGDLGAGALGTNKSRGDEAGEMGANLPAISYE